MFILPVGVSSARPYVYIHTLNTTCTHSRNNGKRHRYRNGFRPARSAHELPGERGRRGGHCFPSARRSFASGFRVEPKKDDDRLYGMFDVPSTHRGRDHSNEERRKTRNGHRILINEYMYMYIPPRVTGILRDVGGFTFSPRAIRFCLFRFTVCSLSAIFE